MTFRQGQSAIVVPVPAVEPLVARWRQRHDPSAAYGMPAHVTVLFPFLRQDRLTDGVLAELSEFCAQLGILEVTFSGTTPSEDVLYLEPVPADQLRHLTLRIADRWPEAPPYEGRFPEVVPHLTVVQTDDPAVLAQAELDVSRNLPVTATLARAVVFVFDGLRWQPSKELPFCASEPKEPRVKARSADSGTDSS